MTPERELDLDVLRAARAETLGVAPSVILFGDKYVLPAALPFAVITAFALDDAATFRAAVVSLLGEDGLAKAVANGASSDDMRDMLVLVTEIYGAADPEV